MDTAVLIADNIGKMVVAIQQVRRGAAVVPNRLGILFCCGLAGGQVAFLDVDFVAAHDIPLGSGQLLIVQIALCGNLPIVALINPECGNTAAVGGSGRNLLAVQIQTELGTVQRVAVLRVYFFNGEVIIC